MVRLHYCAWRRGATRKTRKGERMPNNRGYYKRGLDGKTDPAYGGTDRLEIEYNGLVYVFDYDDIPLGVNRV